MNKEYYERLGKFEITSGTAILTDPCYDTNTRCQIKLDNVKNGTWLAKVYITDCNSWSNRVKRLIVYHKDHLPYGDIFEAIKGEVGVDSGQAGVFDLAKYPKTKEENGEYDDPNTFYGRVCAQTYEEGNRDKHAGIVLEGAVSSSGYGDGAYKAYGAKDTNGQYVAFMIEFIPDEEEDEDSFDQEYEEDDYEEDSVI